MIISKKELELLFLGIAISFLAQAIYDVVKKLVIGDISTYDISTLGGRFYLAFGIFFCAVVVACYIMVVNWLVGRKVDKEEKG